MNTRAGLKLGRFVTPGLTGIAFYLSALLLKIKGYKISGMIPFDMPSNWISLHPALTKKAKDYLTQVNYQRVEKHAEIIYSDKSDFYACREIIIDLLISPIAFAYFIFGRFVIAKSFYANVQLKVCGL